MPDFFKLTFNDFLIKHNGWSGYVAYEVPKPYFVFEFSVADFVPTNALFNSKYTGTWSQVSSSPNRWKLTINNFVHYIHSQTQEFGIGLPFLFATVGAGEYYGYLVSSNLGGGTCKLIDSGNLNITDSIGQTCETMDRMFYGCTGLTYIAPLRCTIVQHVGGMFQGCTEVTEGALAQYTWFINHNINITNHSSTFTNCGSNTQTGTAELAQIPVGWGGTLVPASTSMTSTVKNTGSSSRKIAWLIDSNNPTWTDVKNGMYLFTVRSVSQYAGVSMNRGRINGYNSLGTASGNALYFYPAFVQTVSTVPGTANGTLTWCVTTNTPNGSLTVSQGNTDMPGTLDYGTYGPFAREYGTYDSSKDVYFVFLVTNVPIDQWSGFTDAYGFLWNGGFLDVIGLSWFF